MAAVEPERILQGVEAFAGGLVARVGDPSVRLQQRGGAEIAFAVPPVARTARRAAGAKHAFPQPVQFGAVFPGLEPFPARRRRAVGPEPRRDGGVLGVEHGHVAHQILDDGQVRQRVDADVSLHVRGRPGAGEGVDAVDVHGAAAANPLPARAAERQRRVDLVLDHDEGVEDHRAAAVEVDDERVDRRVAAVVRIPAIDPEGPGPRRAVGGTLRLARADPGIGGQPEPGHGVLRFAVTGLARSPVRPAPVQ